MYLQKVISKKNFFFVDTFKIAYENNRIRIQNPDPLVRGMDPRIQIRIRIRTKISWTRNIVCKLWYSPKNCVRSRSASVNVHQTRVLALLKFNLIYVEQNFPQVSSVYMFYWHSRYQDRVMCQNLDSQLL